MRVTSDHWQLLLSFATNHKEIITNKFMGPNGREKSAILWKNLATHLNGLGFGEKTVDEWKKTLADWKSKTKAKAAKINQNLFQTGGGSPTHISLTNNEEKLLTLMGHTSYKGDIDLECGIETKFRSDAGGKLELRDVSLPSTSGKRKASHTYENNKKRTITNAVPNTSSVETQLNFDHNYSTFEEVLTDDSEQIINNCSNKEVLTNEIPQTPSKSTKRRQKLYNMSEEIKSMNDTTLSVLQNINTNIENVVYDVKRIADALEIIAKK
ncbi:hypothetical protein FQA39_LY11552 [Lamprigera yunnana]|nr:hypothetical protein FQA39_LY11552 [Lamprigera yunnana]